MGEVYSTGSKSLDSLFGGYHKGVLHCFFGPTSSGKTTFAIYNPIAQIFKAEKANLTEKHKFFVVDGDGGFDKDRAEDCWEANGLKPVEITKHLQIWEPTEFSGQHAIFSGGKGGALGELEKFIKEEKYKPLLISADPMTAHYRGIVMRTDASNRMMVLGGYSAKLDLQLMRMRQISKEMNCPAIATSWHSSPVGAAMQKKEEGVEKKGIDPGAGEVPILGGRSFGYLPKIIVELRTQRKRETEEVVKRQALLFKHRSKPAGGACDFVINDIGIADV